MIRKFPLDELRHIAGYTLDKCAYDLSEGDHIGEVSRLHVPSGDMKYSSFWIRDSAMMAESGLVDTDELIGWIKLICQHGQNGLKERVLNNGLVVPPWSIPDHINFDGGSVFYPGMSRSGYDQGNGNFGYFPPLDDGYYFISILYHYWLQARDSATEFLCALINEQSPLMRARLAFDSGSTDKDTGLCLNEMPRYAVDWGFCDTVVKSGLLLFPSLLRFTAAKQLGELMHACGFVDAASYEESASRIRESIASTFVAKDGWLMSATGLCRQPDVWGTAFAAYCGVLHGEVLQAALKALRDGYLSGTVSRDGYIRHIPVDRDSSSTSAWERMSDLLGGNAFPLNKYQNGGYWSTPTGWYAYALHQTDPALAQHLLWEFVDHTLAKKCDGAPYEWKNVDDTEVSGRYYGASAALPFAAASRIASVQGGQNG